MSKRILQYLLVLSIKILWIILLRRIVWWRRISISRLPWIELFYPHLARSRFSSTDSEYICVHSVSNNRVLVCIRGFIIAWLRSIEIPRSARYSKRRQKLSPIRARWSNLAKFQAKFQYRSVPIRAAQRVSNLLEKLARFDPSFSFPFVSRFIFEEWLNDVCYI